MQAGHCQVQHSLSKPAAHMQCHFRLHQQLEQATPCETRGFETNSSKEGSGEMLDSKCDMLLTTCC